MQMSWYNKFAKNTTSQRHNMSKARLDTANAILDDEVQNRAD